MTKQTISVTLKRSRKFATNIDITPETEHIVREELRRGNFQSVDELIVFSVQAWHELNQSEVHAGTPPPNINGKERVRQFVEWAKSHPFTPPLSNDAISRASLNPDRW